MKPPRLSVAALTDEDMLIWCNVDVRVLSRTGMGKSYEWLMHKSRRADRRDADLMWNITLARNEYDSPPAERCLGSRWWEL